MCVGVPPWQASPAIKEKASTETLQCMGQAKGMLKGRAQRHHEKTRDHELNRDKNLIEVREQDCISY